MVKFDWRHFDTRTMPKTKKILKGENKSVGEIERERERERDRERERERERESERERER